MLKCGTARAVITPGSPVRMAGYADRTGPYEGRYEDIWLRALHLSDTESGRRAVIVSADLIWFNPEMMGLLEERLATIGYSRDEVVFTATHNHSGPGNGNAFIPPLENGERAYMERLAGIGCGIKGRRRFERPVPHAAAHLTHGGIVIPVQESGCPAVTVAELVVVPHFPDALVVHGSDELCFHGELVYAVRFPVHVHQVGIKRGHLVESVSVAVVPDFLVYRPQVLFRHHLPETFHRRKARSPVFRIEPIHAAAPVGCRILIMAHRVDCLVRTAIMDSGAF